MCGLHIAIGCAVNRDSHGSAVLIMAAEDTSMSQRDYQHQHTCWRSLEGTAMQELGTKDENSLRGGLVVTVLVKFLYLFAASMLLGLAFGLGTSFLMKRAKSNSVPQVQPMTRTLHVPPFSTAGTL